MRSECHDQIREVWFGHSKYRVAVPISSGAILIENYICWIKESQWRKRRTGYKITLCRFRSSLIMICLSIVSLVVFQRPSSLRIFLLVQWISSLSHGLSGRRVKLLPIIGVCEFRTLARPVLCCSRALSQSPAGQMRSGSADRLERKELK
jgi:hypothetical protein